MNRGKNPGHEDEQMRNWEQGMLEASRDPLALTDLGLPPQAILGEIKARFRTLVRKHHPDVGGSHRELIQLIQQYRKLMDEFN